MRRLVETGVFLGIAGMAHVMFFWAADEQGLEAAGAGGDAAVSLVAIMASAETLVETWERPPEAATTLSEIESPTLQDTASTGPALEYEFSTDAQVKIAALESLEANQTAPEALPTQMPTELSRARPKQLLEAPVMQSPLTQQSDIAKAQPTEDHKLIRPAPQNPLTALEPSLERPSIDTASATPPPEPKPEPAPKEKPKPKPKAQTTAKQAGQNSTGRAAQSASGSGGGKASGNGKNNADVSSGTGKEQSLIRAWKAKIQRRIEQRKREPRGKFEPSRVIILIVVDRSGRVISKGISRSSGQPAIDQAALATISRSGRFPKVPNGVSGSRFEISVPMDFDFR